MNFVIGQIISSIALIISIVIAQFKDIKLILIGEIAGNLSIALSFGFLGGLSGAWVCIVAAAQTIIIYWANEHQLDQKRRNVLTTVFGVIYVAGTVFVYSGWSDVVSCVCAMLYIMAIVQKDAAKYRWYMITNSFLWIIYDLQTAAYVNIITHGMVLVSLTVAKLRLDLKVEK